jgi:hypothetical protein
MTAVARLRQSEFPPSALAHLDADRLEAFCSAWVPFVLNSQVLEHVGHRDRWRDGSGVVAPLAGAPKIGSTGGAIQHTA